MIHLCAKYGHIITNYATGIVISLLQIDIVKLEKKSVFAVCKRTVKTFCDGAVLTSVLWTRVNFLYRVSFFTICFLPSLPCAIFAVCYFAFKTVCYSLPCAAHGKDRRCRVPDIWHTAKIQAHGNVMLSGSDICKHLSFVLCLKKTLKHHSMHRKL